MNSLNIVLPPTVTNPRPPPRSIFGCLKPSSYATLTTMKPLQVSGCTLKNLVIICMNALSGSTPIHPHCIFGTCRCFVPTPRIIWINSWPYSSDPIFITQTIFVAQYPLIGHVELWSPGVAGPFSAFVVPGP